MSSPIPIRRGYIDGPFGQVHLRTTRPASSTHPPLLCLHHSPSSGEVFRNVFARFCRSRAIYAPDIPGYGESDPPPSPPDIAGYALALEVVLDQLGLRAMDILGYHTGAAIAVELARRHPAHVRRLVLIGLPATTLAEHEDVFVLPDGRPWPPPIAADGSHLIAEWRRTLGWHWGFGLTLPRIQRYFLDKLKAAERGAWGSSAALRYPFLERLAELDQPILAIGPRDDLWEISPRVEEHLRHGRFLRWPAHGICLFDVVGEEFFTLLDQHLTMLEEPHH